MSLNLIIPAEESQLTCELEDRIEVIALDYVLDQQKVSFTRDLTVWADEVTINGAINAPGRSMRLFARRVNAINASINVSGAEGNGFLPGNRAKSGMTNSESGAAGNPGGTGQNGGNVILLGETLVGNLTISADGGRGGRGQDGGHGADGTQGPIGANAQGSNEGDYPGQAGGQGGQGGNAGTAGKSGNGGDAGKVVCSFVDISLANITISQPVGGAPGAPGSHGNPGQGGKGGRGGENRRYKWKHASGGGGGGGGVEYLSMTVIGHAPSGPNGAPGLLPGTIPEMGAKGLDGVGDKDPATLAELEAVAPWAYGTLALRRAENGYMAGDIFSAITVCRFLVGLAEAGVPSVNPGSRAHYLIEQFGTDQRDVLAPIAQRANGLLLQMGSGLDFFGRPWNYTPSADFSFYQQVASKLFTRIENIKWAYDEFRKEKTDFTKCLEATSRALQDAESQSQQLETIVQQRLADKVRLESVIDGLLNDVDEQKQVVLDASAAFKQAVSLHGNKCSLNQVVTIISSVVTVATGGATAVMSIAGAAVSAVKEFQKPANWDSSKKVIEDIRVVIGGASQIADAYDQIKGLITPEKPEIAKLLMTREEVESATKPYLDLAEAHNFREAINRYVDLVGAKNGRILEYTQICAEIEHLQAQIYERKETKLKILDALAVAANSDVHLSKLRGFINAAYYEARKMLVYVLYLQHRALCYWTLEVRPFGLADDTLAALALADAQFQVDVAQAYEGISQDFQKFGILDALRRVTISKKTSPTAFSIFKKTNRLTIDVNFDSPALGSLRHVYIDKVRAWIPNASLGQGVEKIFVRITHHGNSRFLNRFDQSIEFCHAPRGVIFEYKIDPKLPEKKKVSIDGELGGTGTKYAQISPFATWTLEVRDADNPGINLSKVTEVFLDFSGTFISPIS